MLLRMASGIIIFIHFFQISESIIPDILKKLFRISKNTYIFRISKISILDIKNNNVGLQKIHIRISKIVISDIRNSYLISEIIILDIQNNYFRQQMRNSLNLI